MLERRSTDSFSSGRLRRGWTWIFRGDEERRGWDGGTSRPGRGGSVETGARLRYEIEIDLANREGKKLVEGTKCDFREAAYGAAVEARVVEVDEKKECKACGMTFECPFPEVCPRCYVE